MYINTYRFSREICGRHIHERARLLCTNSYFLTDPITESDRSGKIYYRNNNPANPDRL